METTKTAITCLGISFDNEDERREYFRKELRKKLPELKKIDGFPIGEDEDIINLSDPPYYTACPNPWLDNFIAEWEKQKGSKSTGPLELQIDEPYANDVSEGKNNPIYNAHGYHTKVPHPAIMRYILYYTRPGDIILDGFAGTGMAGVAAQICGHADPELKLKIEQDFKTHGLHKPIWGERNSILCDLSPIATFISYVYNNEFEFEEIKKKIEKILKDAESELSWLYTTQHTNGQKGSINYIIWSDVFLCPNCNNEIVYWFEGIDKDQGKVNELIKCPSCKKMNKRDELERAFVTKYDPWLKKSIEQAKAIPVLISYSVGKKRYEKLADEADLKLLNKIEEYNIRSFVPIERMPEGDESRRNDAIGITHVHQFWTKRNVALISYLWERASDVPPLKWAISAIIQRANKQHQIAVSRVGGEKANEGGKTAGHRRGTLYIPSLQVEFSVFELLEERLKIVYKALSLIKGQGLISTGSATDLKIKDNSIDYIFVDPPFGANIMYSELNFLWESWLKVKTNNISEAIQNKTQNKTLLEYQLLMEKCFVEYYRILKPRKWITIEFNNTNAAVWNGIQLALQKAGFIISNVSALDKMQETHSARTTPTAVRQDLVISCYKPSTEFEISFEKNSTSVNTWSFVEEHLNHLPIHLKNGNTTSAVIERSAKILYDRLISYYLIRNLSVPIDSKDFQEGLKQKFIERDGMYFTKEQSIIYEQKKAQTSNFVQLSLLVTTESEGIEWLKLELRKAQTYSDLHPKWMQAITAIRKGDILPELKDILNENFIQQDDGKWRTPDLNEVRDRESLRSKRLLNEFQSYIQLVGMPRAKKLKEVRVEALREGFKKSWEKKDFTSIVKVGDMIPQNILLEDEKLLMYYDIAKDRV